MHRVMVWIGIAFLMAGFVTIGIVISAGPDIGEPVPPIGSELPAEARRDPQGGQPSLAWSVAGGVSMAVGATLIGIGLNRWREH